MEGQPAAKTETAVVTQIAIVADTLRCVGAITPDGSRIRPITRGEGTYFWPIDASGSFLFGEVGCIFDFVKRKAPSPRALPLSNNDVLLADRPVVRGAMPMDALFNYVLPVTKETVDEIFDGLVKENKFVEEGSNCTSMGYLLLQKKFFRFKAFDETRCEFHIETGKEVLRYEVKVTSQSLRQNHDLRIAISEFPEDKKLILCLGLTTPYAKLPEAPKYCYLILTGIIFQDSDIRNLESYKRAEGWNEMEKRKLERIYEAAAPVPPATKRQRLMTQPLPDAPSARIKSKYFASDGEETEGELGYPPFLPLPGNHPTQRHPSGVPFPSPLARRQATSSRSAPNSPHRTRQVLFLDDNGEVIAQEQLDHHPPPPSLIAQATFPGDPQQLPLSHKSHSSPTSPTVGSSLFETKYFLKMLPLVQYLMHLRQSQPGLWEWMRNRDQSIQNMAARVQGLPAHMRTNHRRVLRIVVEELQRGKDQITAMKEFQIIFYVIFEMFEEEVVVPDDLEPFVCPFLGNHDDEMFSQPQKGKSWEDDGAMKGKPLSPQHATLPLGGGQPMQCEEVVEIIKPDVNNNETEKSKDKGSIQEEKVYHEQEGAHKQEPKREEDNREKEKEKEFKEEKDQRGRATRNSVLLQDKGGFMSVLAEIVFELVRKSHVSAGWASVRQELTFLQMETLEHLFAHSILRVGNLIPILFNLLDLVFVCTPQ